MRPSENKKNVKWFSERLQREVNMVRWGTFGQPVLMFPTAGGDCEEIERFLMVKALAPLIDAGRMKLYSCDSVAGKAMITQEGTPGHRQWVLNQFHQYIRHELVPAPSTRWRCCAASPSCSARRSRCRARSTFAAS